MNIENDRQRKLHIFHRQMDRKQTEEKAQKLTDRQNEQTVRQTDIKNTDLMMARQTDDGKINRQQDRQTEKRQRVNKG